MSIFAAAVLATLVTTLTGCSIDAVIWGQDGARVIETTETLIGEMAAGEPSELICAGATAEAGEPADWIGLSAGEPEHFVADYWTDQVPHDPQWSINLESLPDGLEPGVDFPGDLFYRETDEGLCVVDIVWSTLVSTG